MERGPNGVVETVRATVQEVLAEDVTFVAGSIAYHAFVSLVPILVVASLVLSAVGDDALVVQVVALTDSYLPATARQFVRRALVEGAGTRVSVIGGLALAWGTLKVFRGLDVAFTHIYDSSRRNSLPDKLRDGVVVLVALGVALSTLVVTGLFAVVPEGGIVGWVANTALALAGLMVAFYPLYYVFPDVDVSPTGVLPGVALAAVGWFALKSLFGLYVEFSSLSDAYGVVGGVILLVTWLYFSALVLLTGAALNAVRAGRAGDHAWGDSMHRAATSRPTPELTAVDTERFERSLDRLVADAREQGVGRDEIRRALQRRADEVAGASESNGSADAAN